MEFDNILGTMFNLHTLPIEHLGFRSKYLFVYSLDANDMYRYQKGILPFKVAPTDLELPYGTYFPCSRQFFNALNKAEFIISFNSGVVWISIVSI